MASLFVCFVIFLTILKPLSLSVSASPVSEFLSPLLSPVFDDICKNVECGKGICKATSDSDLLFECECNDGWKQTTSDQTTDHLKFLPCVIPNCTLNYSCSKTPQPVQDKASNPNESIFDPCYWSHCGTGTCNKTSKLSYECLCPSGFYNLLNISTFPCFESCEIGMDCKSLGISNSNQNSSSNSALGENDDICKDVECGKGRCKETSNSELWYECECEAGWKQTISDHTSHHLKFLPCVIPNCTLNYSCSKTPQPLQDKTWNPNESIFDPCFWSHCGTGSCNKTSKFSYECLCPLGYHNLLNIPTFPCLDSCEIGVDCNSLGISNSNQSYSINSVLGQNSKNQASSNARGNLVWSIVAIYAFVQI